MQQPPPSQLLDEEATFEADRPEVLVLACGAIAREVLAVVRLNGWEHVTVRCLPGKLHSTPNKIAGAVDAKLRELKGRYERVFVAYADCGTGGELDKVLAEHGVDRLPGDHCYGFFAGVPAWEAMHDAEPATFYLTDFLARHFDALIVRAYRFEEHPELISMVFGNYKRVLYLAQTDDPDLDERARAAADYLGLEYERQRTGYGDLIPSLTRFAAVAPPAGEAGGTGLAPEKTATIRTQTGGTR